MGGIPSVANHSAPNSPWLVLSVQALNRRWLVLSALFQNGEAVNTLGSGFRVPGSFYCGAEALDP
jgi:hypothetical protein